MGEKREGRRKKFPAEAEENFFPFSLLPRSAYCEEEGGGEGEGEESGLLGRKISFPLSGGGRKGKGPSLLPTLKSDHGKASKLNENGERRVGRASLAKIRRRGGTLWETAVCGWLQYWRWEERGADGRAIVCVTCLSSSKEVGFNKL